MRKQEIIEKLDKSLKKLHRSPHSIASLEGKLIQLVTPKVNCSPVGNLDLMMIEHPKTFNKFKSLSASKNKNNKSKYRQPQRHPGEGSYPSGGPKEAPRMYSKRE